MDRENEKKKIENEYGEDFVGGEGANSVDDGANNSVHNGVHSEAKNYDASEVAADAPRNNFQKFTLDYSSGLSPNAGFNTGYNAGGYDSPAAVLGGQFAPNAGNKVFLKGSVDSKLNFSHELYGEGFYEFFMLVPRLSQQFDRLPVTVSERLMEDVDLSIGAPIALNGQFRSYNKLEGERSKLMLTVFARDFVLLSTDDANPNIAELSGYICKPPVYRTTPFSREICDLLLAVNRAYNKSDYIPCIAWGRNARFVKTIAVGQRILASGRIQSREYNKKISEDAVEVRTAYELSINKIVIE